jgi:site-specific DNA-methyltransferase (adenine-specific)
MGAAAVSIYYSDDLVTLHHGDCREVSDWLRADVLVTDPPYGIAWPAGRLDSDRAKRGKAVQSIVNDEDTVARDVVLQMWGDKPSIVFGTWRKPLRQTPNHRLIWHKAGRHPGVSPHPFYPNDEEIWLSGGGWTGAPTPTVLTTTEQRSQEPARVGHPTPKPIGLMERLIEKAPDGVIADPFAGGGQRC